MSGGRAFFGPMRAETSKPRQCFGPLVFKGRSRGQCPSWPKSNCAVGCSGLSVFPPNSHVEALVPQREGVWRCDFGKVLRVRRDHEDGALMMGLVSLEEETREPGEHEGQ